MAEELEGRSGYQEKASETEEMKVDSSSSLSMAEELEGRSGNLEKASETKEMKVDSSSSLSMAEELEGRSGYMEKASETKEMKVDSLSSLSMAEELEGKSGYLEKASEMEEMKVDSSSSLSMAVVFPPEDVIQALLDYLVDPMLPVKSSSSSVRDHSSSLSLQKSIAKQMHAVALLYNYYHKKQFPHLEFLDFESFCKVSVNAKPSLLVHMKFMHRCDSESNESKELLSLTEKAIMDACNVSLGLDALRGAPSMNEWPVSKVVIFLIDNMKKSCFLLFSSITQGVWSLIEKTVDGSVTELDDNLENENANKKKQTMKRPFASELNANEVSFRKLAFSAVKETTGIDQADLRVLERHIVPSLSAEKTAACFYLVRCTKPADQDLIQVPIEDAINSLQGPLVKKEFGSYSVSSVVEYFHLLPYAGILSDWLSRADQENVDMEGSPVADNFCHIEVNENNDESETDDILGEKTNNKVNKDEKGHPSKSVTTQDKVSINHLDKKMKSSAGDDLCIGKKMKSSAEGDLNIGKKMKTSGEGDLSIGKSASKCKVIKPRNVGKGKISAAYIEGRSLKDGEERSGTFLEKGLKLGNEAEKVIELCNSRCTGTSVACGNDNCNMGFSRQDAIPTGDHSVFPSLSNAQNHNEIQTTIFSNKHEFIQAAQGVLLMKRDELSRQQRLLQDEIALCERSLHTVSSGDDYLMLKIDSIIEICNVASQRVTSQTRMETHQHFGTRSSPLPEAIPSLRGPCQELDIMCCQKKWMLPRYSVSPLNGGGFGSTVIVQGMGFECSDSGDLKGDPREARESAAAHILTKLRGMASQDRRSNRP